METLVLPVIFSHFKPWLCGRCETSNGNRSSPGYLLEWSLTQIKYSLLIKNWVQIISVVVRQSD